jgi:putative flippase GtrA
MKPLAERKAILPELGRFVAAGLGNTLVTILVYQAAVSVMAPLAAYVLSWCVGIGIVMLAYPKLVFQRETNLLNAGIMGAIYLVAFGIGCAVTTICVRLQVPDRAIIIVAAGVTSIVAYVCGRQVGAFLPNGSRSPDRP